MFGEHMSLAHEWRVKFMGEGILFKNTAGVEGIWMPPTVGGLWVGIGIS